MKPKQSDSSNKGAVNRLVDFVVKIEINLCVFAGGGAAWIFDRAIDLRKVERGGKAGGCKGS